MKKTFLILCLFSSIVMMGKPFAPIGTTWHYGYTFIGGDQSYVACEVVDTLLIGGKMCSKIVHGAPMCEYQSTTDYLYEENGVVYYYIPSTLSFSILYDFNTPVGSTWIIHNPDENITVKVDSINTVNILNTTLKKMCVTYNRPVLGSRTGTIIEKIGDNYSLFYFYQYLSSTCDAGWLTGLRCYNNPDLGFYKNGAVDCDYTTGFSTAKNGLFKIAITNGTLSIESKTQAINSVKLITMTGITVYEDTPVKSNLYTKQINYTGILICVVSLENGEVVTEKILLAK